MRPIIGERVLTFIGLDNLPETIRSLTTLTSVNYADLYTAPTTDVRDMSPERWARAVLEGTPLGQRARVLWRFLGLRLGPQNSASHVQGWKIAARGENWIRVETSSWFMTAHAVCHVEDEHLSVALFLRYDRPIGALIWKSVSRMHQRAVPVLLHQALTRRSGASCGASAPEGARSTGSPCSANRSAGG